MNKINKSKMIREQIVSYLDQYRMMLELAQRIEQQREKLYSPFISHYGLRIPGIAGKGVEERLDQLQQLTDVYYDLEEELSAVYKQTLELLAQLPERQACAVTLRFLSGLTVEETSVAMGVTKRQVIRLTSRAFEHLAIMNVEL